MRQISTKQHHGSNLRNYRSALILIVGAAVLSACGTTGGGKQTEPVPEGKSPAQELPQGTSRELPPSEFAAEFSRAEQYLFDFDWMAAQTTLENIPSDMMSATDQQYLGYLQARILYVRGKQGAADSILRTLSQTTQHPALRQKILSFRRFMYSLSGEYLQSARLGDQLLRQAVGDTESSALQRGIWRDLQHLGETRLQLAIDSASDPQWRGWLELARLGAKTGFDPRQATALAQWRESNPDHPAARVLPGGMDYLPGPDTEPSRVALLLPLSGRLAPAARAVRDGYLSDYYLARAAGADALEIDVLDVLDFRSITDAYRAAVAGGAQFIVGPLRKTAVADLAGLPNRAVPVLALNRVNNILPQGETAFVQLSLAPEDEASQIANLAFGQGGRRALVIRPAGSWGNKMDTALKEQWQKLGGEIAATATYSSREDYSNSMSAALNLPASKQRAREIRSMLATQIETTSRRRQDIDTVFLLSKSGAEARSLKPLLAYHYASDLPVYATSNIYRGVADSRDKDLNGIQLIEIPWLLGANPQARAAIKAGVIGSESYTRLNALGADAYLLQSKFSLLRAGENMLIRGNTGLLSLTPELQIKRELSGATFDGSTLVAP